MHKYFSLAIFLGILAFPVLMFWRTRLPGETLGAWLSRIEYNATRRLQNPEGFWLGPLNFAHYLLAMCGLTYGIIWMGTWLIVFGGWVNFRETWDQPDTLPMVFGLWFELIFIFTFLQFGRFYTRLTLPGRKHWLTRIFSQWLEVSVYCLVLLHGYAYFLVDAPQIPGLRFLVVGKDFIKPEPFNVAFLRMLNASEEEIDRMIAEGKLPRGFTGPDTSPRVPPNEQLTRMKAAYTGPLEPSRMVRLKGGQFMMGCKSTEKASYRDFVKTFPPATPEQEEITQRLIQDKIIPDPDQSVLRAMPWLGCDVRETPQHPVDLKPFEISAHEVTFDEWDACVADGGCLHWPDDEGLDRGKRPVVNVNWIEVERYVDWLNNKTGKHYRLPTEAEWEYAARAGTDGEFSTGDCLKLEYANFNGTNENSNCETLKGMQQALPVGSLEPNPWGLYDMHGNVAEWTRDCRTSHYEHAVKEGSVPSDGHCVRRMVRGGSWKQSAEEARSAYRGNARQDVRINSIGFRLARDY